MQEMSVCKFYLRGNCRYGDGCRNRHEGGSPQRRPAPRIPANPMYRFPYFPPEHPRRSSSPQTRNSNDSKLTQWIFENFTNRDKAIDIIKYLREEARMWERSTSFWRFTSRCLFPGGCQLPNWADQSFEEIKWAHRWMSLENKEHQYKKAYSEYWEQTERDLVGLSRLRFETLQSFKPYIEEYANSNYHPKQAFASDVEMVDVNDPRPTNFSFQTPVVNYTPVDQLPEQARAAFESDTFEFGEIPTQAPPQQFC